MKWVCFPKFYSPLANWSWLRISPHSSLYVIYCSILTTWQWLMSFTCIPVQIEPHKSPLRKRLLALLLWEICHLSSPSRSCLGRFIVICGRLEWGMGVGRALQVECNHKRPCKIETRGRFGYHRGSWRCNDGSKRLEWCDKIIMSQGIGPSTNWKRQENWFSLRASGRSAALPTSLFQPTETHFRLLAFRTVRQYICADLSH